ILAYTEGHFLSAVRPGDVAYVWPGARVQLYERLKEKGAILVAERINCHTAVARPILEAEYAALGWRPDHDVTETLVREEREEMRLADLVYSPSPMVDDSLRVSGVDPRKILPCSYGWDPQRVGGSAAAAPETRRDEGLKVLFVGY